MAEILCRTRGNTNPKGKPRVYFTCHPEDFELYFDKICEDIFKTHDCAIFYKGDMSATIDGQDKETDLGSNNLFVVPVTFKLLTEPNQAMDEDVAYAMEKNIPILPFVMEQNIRQFYVQKFGQRQFLRPFSEDSTEISYEKKLEKYLESVLISEETAKKIRAEFAAYIFLSYRKKDRRYANKLMKLIHSDPEFQDIAIWFDEFLTPGEDFKVNIEKALKKSKLFALLVTPNLLEEDNFVMREEYPAARKAGKAILPAEIKKTDRTALSAKFEDIPPCVNPRDAQFKEILLKTFAKLKRRGKNTGPMHEYLIGLAYLEGIDVETNRERGLALITSAAESDLPEAMEKLYGIYEAQGNYRKAGAWAKQLARHYLKLFGKDHPVTLEWLGNVAYIFGSLGEYSKALALQEKVYTLCCRKLGNEHPKTTSALGNLAWLYDAMGDYVRAMEYSDKLYAIRCENLGAEHPDTLRALSYLAKIYCHFGEYKTALEFEEQVYQLRRKHLGAEHPETLIAMNDLAVIYDELRQCMTAVELAQEAYNVRCRISGAEHPETLTCLSNLANSLSQLYRDSRKPIEKSQQVYTLRCKVLGKHHPQTLEALNNLALAYCDQYDFSEGQRLCQQALEQAEEKLGEEHPTTLRIMFNLGSICAKLGDTERKLELFERHKTLSRNTEATVVPIREKMLEILRSADPEKDILEQLRTQSGLTMAPTHPSTRFWLNMLLEYRNRYEAAQRVALLEKCCELYELIYGESHPLTIEKLEALVTAYAGVPAYEKELQLRSKLCRILGIEDLCGVASVYSRMGDYQKAKQLYEQKLQADPENCAALESLSMLCERMGDTEEADRLLERMLESDPSRAMFIYPKAEAYRAAGRYDRALFLYTRNYEYWRDTLGEDTYALVKPLENMAEMCELMGETEKAAQLREKASVTEQRARIMTRLNDLERKVGGTYGRNAPRERMELQEEIYNLRCEGWGEEHRETVIALTKLVYDSYACGEYRKSEQWCRRLYVLCVRLDGKEHPDTISVAKDLKTIWKTLGLCSVCGGEFTEEHICRSCGKPKNY